VVLFNLLTFGYDCPPQLQAPGPDHGLGRRRVRLAAVAPPRAGGCPLRARAPVQRRHREGRPPAPWIAHQMADPNPPPGAGGSVFGTTFEASMGARFFGQRGSVTLHGGGLLQRPYQCEAVFKPY